MRSAPRGNSAFTLTEMLIAIAILAILVLLITRLVNSAAMITTLGNRRMDAEGHARPLFERMAIDFAQIVKSRGVSYYLKAGGSSSSMTGDSIGVNDRLAFFTSIPGYYASSLGYDSGVSLTAYRINADPSSAAYNKLERMGKGLPLNGAYATITPILFLNNVTSPTTTIDNIWPAATRAFPDASYSTDSDYEVAGPQVFRLEYNYNYKVPSGGTAPVDYPTTWTSVDNIAINDVASFVVSIAVVDSKSRALLSNAQLSALAGRLVDYSSGWPPGELLSQWQTALDGVIDMPRPAVSGIRLYQRHFYLNR
jgi:prepilin-type N-terminal cleavage/methylation domain-containing protein